MRIALILATMLAVAGCSGGTSDNSTAPVAVENVAAVAPPAGRQWADVVEKTAEGGFRMGNPDAAIKLIEYGSRTCHVCEAFAKDGMGPLKATYIASGKVSYEYRDFIRNGADLGASLLGQCSGPEPFFALLDQMFLAQATTLDTLQKLPPAFYDQLGKMPPAQQTAAYAEAAGYIEFVKQRGVPEAKARACLADVKAAEAITKVTQDGVDAYQIQGTPTFLLNGKVVPDTVNWQQVEAALKAAGA